MAKQVFKINTEQSLPALLGRKTQIIKGIHITTAPYGAGEVRITYLPGLDPIITGKLRGCDRFLRLFDSQGNTRMVIETFGALSIQSFSRFYLLRFATN
tara:strand:- start:18 stop:314 length:297 start_codon:yes stop_codon:yes gene_type:complete